MKLRSRLSYFSVIIFGILFIFTSVFIYTLFYRWARNNEYKNLQNTTLVAAVYYLEKDEQTHAEHISVQNELQRLISRRNIAVFDQSNQVAFGLMDRDSLISKSILEKTREQEYYVFESSNHFYAGIHYHDNQGDFVVFTKSSKESFQQQMNVLLWILFTVFIISLVVIFLFSKWLGKIAYQPILHIIRQVRTRDHQNLTSPINVDKSYEEVDELVNVYNHFINRIAQTFHVQKNFIDYVSHELRTPITALLGTLEVTGQKKRTIDDYELVIQQLKEYTTDLQDTLDQMMLLSGVKTNFDLERVRIDEVIWQVVENAMIYHDAKITVEVTVERMDLLMITGNDKLLELAFNNIIENAIKYSDNKPIEVILQESDSCLEILVKDLGIGIMKEDIQHITQNFFRGKNVSSYQGKGVGLSLADIIFKFHRAKLKFISEDVGTTVSMSFEHHI